MLEDGRKNLGEMGERKTSWSGLKKWNTGILRKMVVLSMNSWHLNEEVWINKLADLTSKPYFFFNFEGRQVKSNDLKSWKKKTYPGKMGISTKQDTEDAIVNDFYKKENWKKSKGSKMNIDRVL